jgi:hypothetical protein
MAMTFTLVTNVREQLSTVLQDRVKKKKEEEAGEERKALEVGVVLSTYSKGSLVLSQIPIYYILSIDS